MMKPKRPSCVKASREAAVFISYLREGSYLLKIVNSGVNNLYKFNLNSRVRLIYTLVADESGVAVVVLEIMDHKKYEERFGYG